MYNCRILYGYVIQNGEMIEETKEAITVKRIFASYLEGLSYQTIDEMLNEEKSPYSQGATEWNKHKVKRLLENPRYIGEKEYSVIIEKEIFEAVQQLIQSKTAGHTSRKAKEEIWSYINNEETGLIAYTPSAEIMKIDNAINRDLENVKQPEEIINLILQGFTARYNCCG